MMTFLAGCATSDAGRRLGDAAQTQAQAGLVGEALDATRDLPPQPQDCSRQERSGVRSGDRLDAALVKTDNALTRANQRVRRCHEWYNGLRGATGGR